MDKNVGVSFTLSVLTVAFFAIALYQPDTPRPTASSASAKPVEAPPPVVRDRTVVKVAPPEHETAPARREVAATVVRSLSPAQAQAPLARPEPSKVTPPARPARRSRPRGAFTTVEDGETLADVARRVYGDGGSVEALWEANRDLIGGKDVPLPTGSLLRTP